MLAFERARRALLCAIDIQRSFGQATEHPRVRIGVHTGEAIHEEGELYGENVVVAARVGATARGGEILASAIVKQLTESSGDLRFGAGRETVLKGLSGRYTVYPSGW
jgi:class 3 adenylate cyclase